MARRWRTYNTPTCCWAISERRFDWLLWENWLRHTLRLFHPLGFMLASPIDSPEEGLSYFAEAVVEDKYDGIRAQAHVSGDEVKIFSRARDDITESFPELPQALAGLPQDAILDGEIVAWHYPKGLSETKQVGG